MPKPPLIFASHGRCLGLGWHGVAGIRAVMQPCKPRVALGSVSSPPRGRTRGRGAQARLLVSARDITVRPDAIQPGHNPASAGCRSSRAFILSRATRRPEKEF